MITVYIICNQKGVMITMFFFFQMLGARGSKGVMAVVENLSNRQLDEPHFHARFLQTHQQNPQMDVAPWCCKWTGLGWIGGARYRAPYGAKNEKLMPQMLLLL